MAQLREQRLDPYRQVSECERQILYSLHAKYRPVALTLDRQLAYQYRWLEHCGLLLQSLDQVGEQDVLLGASHQMLVG